jgi:tellurite methyltransferase
MLEERRIQSLNMPASSKEPSKSKCPGKTSFEERECWNQKYRESPGSWLEPDPLLIRAFAEYVRPRFPKGGQVLDFAGGAGRNAIWLAQRGWEVTLMDISDTGIELARQKAGPVASHIHFVIDDLTGFRSSQTQFDLVVVFFYLERRIFPEIVKAIRPGGILIYKTCTLEQAKLEGGPKDPAFLLQPGELSRLARGLRVLEYNETVAKKATAELIAVKER